MNTESPKVVRPEDVAILLDNGWKTLPTSCGCGGKQAWLKPRSSGAMEMFGCVCHHTTQAIQEVLAHQ